MKNIIAKTFTTILIGMVAFLDAQTINRYGTTTANFLEIGVGSRATSMGDAYVAVANDVSSIYWNPAGLAHVTRSSALFSIQPWLVDIDMMFAGGAFVVPSLGVIGLGITHLDYGEMDVTNLQYQDGTGERFGASDVAATFTFSRKIVSWFSFGSSMKYISSKIWHSSASAFAVDLYVGKRDYQLYRIKAEGDFKMTLVKKFFQDDSGATAIEYGLIAALVSVAAITALTAMGTSLEAMFTAVSTALTAAIAP